MSSEIAPQLDPEESGAVAPVEPVKERPEPVPYPAHHSTDPVVGAQKSLWGGVIAAAIALLEGGQIAASTGADLSDWKVWLNIVLAALVGGSGTSAAVYRIPNKVVYR